eukprot:3748379-Pyramimonas_sp.AAC.2
MEWTGLNSWQWYVPADPLFRGIVACARHACSVPNLNTGMDWTGPDSRKPLSAPGGRPRARG